MRKILFRVALPAVIVLFLSGMARAPRGLAAESAPPSSEGVTQPADSAPQAPPPGPQEQRCGIQIVRIAVTAAGGMVDLRFKVLDAAKARKLLKDPANVPVLNPEGSSYPLKAPRNALMGAQFKNGFVNYILYPNVRSAVKPGTRVTVAVGEVRLDPITAQ